MLHSHEYVYRVENVIYSNFLLKFMFSNKATKFDKIFTFDLTLCSKCQIVCEDFVDFRGLLRKHWFFPLSYYLHSHSPIAIFKSELPVFLEKRSHESIIKKKLGTPFISIIIINIFKMSLVLIQTPLRLKKNWQIF